MRNKRDKRQAQHPWYVRPITFRVITFVLRALIGIFDW